MTCPQCGSSNLRDSVTCSREPHGECHDDVFIECSNGHRFDESEALDDELAPVDVLALRIALAEMQPVAVLADGVLRRGEWQ